MHFLGEHRVASLYLSHSPSCKTTYTVDIIFFNFFFLIITVSAWQSKGTPFEMTPCSQSSVDKFTVICDCVCFPYF